MNINLFMSMLACTVHLRWVLRCGGQKAGPASRVRDDKYRDDKYRDDKNREEK